MGASLRASLARGQFKRGAMLRQQGTLFVLLLTAWQAYAPTPSPPPGPPPPSQPGKGNTLVQVDGTLIDNSHVRVRARFSSRIPAVSTLLAQLGGQEGALFEGKPYSKEQKKMNGRTHHYHGGCADHRALAVHYLSWVVLREGAHLH